jgi:hypothetical protein
VESGRWWFCFADWSGGFSCQASDLELYNREPEHVMAWRGMVSRWESWLRGGK